VNAPKSQTEAPEAKTSGASPVEVLRVAGPLLFGDLWHQAAARLLGVSDRSIYYWLKGERTAPARIVPELESALWKRLLAIQDHLRGA